RKGAVPVHADRSGFHRPFGKGRRDRRFQLHLGAERDIDAAIGFCDIRFGGLSVSQEVVQQRPQERCEFDKRRSQHQAFAHIDDRVRLERVKSEFRCALSLGDLEDRATPRRRRHRDHLGHFGLAYSLFLQCTDDSLALACAISVILDVLQSATAADAKVNAARVHAFLAAIRNSRLPSPPSIGLSSMPRTSQPLMPLSQLEMSLSAACCASASRTSPPLSTAYRPTSNCGFTNATSQEPPLAMARAGGRACLRPTKLTSATMA